MFSRKFLLIFGVLLLAVATMFLGTAASSPFQTPQPKPPVETKGPIIALVIASSINAKGQIVNPRFTFPPNEPQITAIVYVGKIDASQLKVTWYKTSEDGDQRLFEHQVPIKSYERAFSVAKNPGGSLQLGADHVVATLAGQTEEIEFDVSPRKQQKKTSSRPDDELFEDQAEARGIDRAFSAETNTGELLAASSHERVVERKAQIQKVAWDAASRVTRSSTTSSQAAQQGKRPVAGSSGTAPQSASPPSQTSDSGCSMGVVRGPDYGHPYDDWTADAVEVYSEAVCQGYYTVKVYARAAGAPRMIGEYSTDSNAEVVFPVNPCSLSGGSDLPGAKVSVS